MGGAYGVRGYRENQIAYNNGLVSSLEVRIPLWKDEADRPVQQRAPFADTGRS